MTRADHDAGAAGIVGARLHKWVGAPPDCGGEWRP
jgi:hypothetical protein